MAKYVDFVKLKARVTILDILAHYDLDLRKTDSGTYVGDCPVCGSEDSESEKFKATPADGKEHDRWNCFGACKGGNSIDLVAAMEGVSNPKAAQLIATWFEITDCFMDEQPRSNKSGAGVSKLRPSARKVNESRTLEPVKDEQVVASTKIVVPQEISEIISDTVELAIANERITELEKKLYASEQVREHLSKQLDSLHLQFLRTQHKLGYAEAQLKASES